MVIAMALLLLAAVVAVATPSLLGRASWPDREPVLALWAWQCAVAAVLLCCALAMALSAASAWERVRSGVFAPAPHGVVEAYGLGSGGSWSAALAALLAAGGAWTAVAFVREVRHDRSVRRRRRAELLVRAPLLPGEEPSGDRLVVLEGDRPDAWWLPGGTTPRLVITTGALRRLRKRQLDAVLAHEQGHSRARHHWLLYCAGALANGFPQIPVFAAFRDQVHRLCELAADDAASRRFGRMTFATALLELNEDRGVFGPCPPQLAQVPQRVDRLLAPGPRLTPGRRLRMTACAALVPAVPLLVAFVPGLSTLA
ncbi:M56 family metallopeptidase [Streptomyces sp. A7024]|uniref:M56 family metallopeptidase n=1 Tax=Streptomyces coryli TaxID=1128680 RepID=A0A6G4TYE2_9ACTN|nr:M56 family metallopeptidase [Streptomyces coryli]NGN64466.1 M56 family metallopeptidase [Streptomyces coryli]